jgi:hypothetical protein
MKIYRNILLTPLVLWALMGPVATYRAWVQVRSVSIATPATPLRAGSQVRADIVTSGRTDNALVLELVQGERVEELAYVWVPPNRFPYWNWRAHPATATATLTAGRLARFAPGPATLRATGHGGAQWMRVPPPVIRERTVQLDR